MGTYTTNKNLFMPSVGETGWGELVNGNFETIDNFLKPISLSGSTYTFTGNHVGNQSGGSVSATTGTFSGAVTGATFNGVPIKLNGTYTVAPTSTIGGYIPFKGSAPEEVPIFLAPFLNNKYSGSIKIYNPADNGGTIYYATSQTPLSGSGTTTFNYTSMSISANSSITISFTNISWLGVIGYCGGLTSKKALQYYQYDIA